jgi:hypothetical protein
MSLEGKLRDMPISDLLRILQRSMRSGKLMLWSETEWACVWLQRGEVVNAIVIDKDNRHPLHTGELAIFHFFLWRDGSFTYSHDPESEHYLVTIRRPTAALIVEALQRRRNAPVAPAASELSVHTALRLLPHMAGLPKRIQLNVEEWFVLTHIGQQNTIQLIIDQTALPAAQVQSIVSRLIEHGLVVPIAVADLLQRQLGGETSGYDIEGMQGGVSITNLTRAIRRRLQQIVVGAR